MSNLGLMRSSTSKKKSKKTIAQHLAWVKQELQASLKMQFYAADKSKTNRRWELFSKMLDAVAQTLEVLWCVHLSTSLLLFDQFLNDSKRICHLIL